MKLNSRETGLFGVLVMLVIATLAGCSSDTDREVTQMEADMAWASTECAKSPGCER